MNMETNETQAEVVLTPYLQQVMERARGLDFEARPMCSESTGLTWLSIIVGSGTISVFESGRHILGVQTQNMPAVALVQEARRVADAARLILDVDAPTLPAKSVRMDIERHGRMEEVQVEFSGGAAGRARMTDDERTEVVLTRAEEREAEELWMEGRP